MTTAWSSILKYQRIPGKICAGNAFFLFRTSGKDVSCLRDSSVHRSPFSGQENERFLRIIKFLRSDCNKERILRSDEKKIRHFQYLKHFLLPRPDAWSTSDCEDGDPLIRDVRNYQQETRRLVEEMIRTVSGLYSKETCLDLSLKGEVKRPTGKMMSFEHISEQFRKAAYSDQHVVIRRAASALIDVLSGFAYRESHHLPQVSPRHAYLLLKPTTSFEYSGEPIKNNNFIDSYEGKSSIESQLQFSPTTILLGSVPRLY